MLRLATILFALSGTLALVEAQSLPEYLRMRKQHSVTQATDLAALDTFVGSTIVEARGVVKGSFRVGDRTSLLFERPDGKTQIVESVVVPNWLVGNEIPVRLLVRATREEALGRLRVVLIGAAPESDVKRLDDEAARRAQATRTAAANKPKAKAGAKAPATWTARSPLSGTITRNGTRLASRGTARRTTVPDHQVAPIYAAFIKKYNSRLPNAEALRIAQAVIYYSQHYKVDARLVMAILLVESGFDPTSVSRAGAMGLGQLMPGTARWMGVADPFDTTQNLYGSIKLLSQHLAKYRRQTRDDLESLVLSLAAYNAGEGAVRRHGGVPPYRETQRYVRKVVGLYYKLAGM
ncbi:MAG: lytic transglycosylase domain-containing protein [Fimbriimonas sp.]